ncbi:capsule biosynthesis protein CapC [Psychromonas sp. RZ22]|uniref:tyrosine-protein phosphatase n=1 Tax=Psychromonas algarum TaxID=2555643 RepID=UPI0010677E50|nr:CpsB/CapC family capsule biosynthesis tyrosine phosphatase [Psychromonas sp. RZ22]TEW56148.1 capsule biosynthesis protein CapC [Psychromonas sp. RZ22]
MIDLHSHILAGIDDGARSIDDSIALISQSVDSGVNKIIATPHLNIGSFDNDLAGIEDVFHHLFNKIIELNITVELAFAAEVRICPEIILLAKNKQLPFLGKHKGQNLLLLEFPDSHIPPGSEKLVAWLFEHNICPIIAHPERNRDLWEHPNLIDDFIKQGCLLQITAASLLGGFGEKSQKLGWHYINLGLVHVVASDMHNLKRRPNRMLEAYKAITEKFDINKANKLCIDNPNSIFISNAFIKSFKEIL